MKTAENGGAEACFNGPCRGALRARKRLPETGVRAPRSTGSSRSAPSVLFFPACGFPQEALEMLFKLIRLEAAWARSSLVNPLAILADQVHSVGIAAIALRRRIFHIIDQHRHGEIQLLRAGAGDLGAPRQDLGDDPGFAQSHAMKIIERGTPPCAREVHVALPSRAG